MILKIACSLFNKKIIGKIADCFFFLAEIQEIETTETLNEKHIISQNDDDDDDDDDDNDDLSVGDGKYIVYNLCGTR